MTILKYLLLWISNRLWESVYVVRRTKGVFQLKWMMMKEVLTMKIDW
jgi:hypothetical protein